MKKKIIESWNNTIKSKAIVVHPKNTLELRKLIKFLKKNNKKYLIRTGSCSYDSKSINPDLETVVISLKLFNKVLSLNNKKRFVEVEAGALISDVIKKIKKKECHFIFSTWRRKSISWRCNFSKHNWKRFYI